MSMIVLARAVTVHNVSIDFLSAAATDTSGRGGIALVVVLLLLVVLAMASSVGRMLAAGLAAAVKTASELFSALIRLAGMSTAAVVVAGLLLYGMLR